MQIIGWGGWGGERTLTVHAVIILYDQDNIICKMIIPTTSLKYTLQYSYQALEDARLRAILYSKPTERIAYAILQALEDARLIMELAHPVQHT